MGQTGRHDRETGLFRDKTHPHKSQCLKIPDKKLTGRADVSTQYSPAAKEGMLNLPKVPIELARRSFHYQAAAFTQLSLSLNRYITTHDLPMLSGGLRHCLPGVLLSAFIRAFIDL